MNLLMLALGMLFKVFAVTLITVPLVMWLLDSLGISTIHYAVVVTVNMELVLISLLIELNLMCCHRFQKRRLAPWSRVFYRLSC
jgi:C4-dicarboxylate transporter DctM subunit